MKSNIKLSLLIISFNIILQGHPFTESSSIKSEKSYSPSGKSEIIDLACISE